MLVGASRKNTVDRFRVVVDFIDWLDPGEGISANTTPAVRLDTSVGTWSASITTPPADTTPLTVYSVTSLDATTKLMFLLDAGTPSLAYLVSFVVTGSTSGRKQETEFRVTVTP